MDQAVNAYENISKHAVQKKLHIDNKKSNLKQVYISA